ncbi:DBH-like monooxygenase protein 1 [Montipora capricornis]|uniref:DBH-like monooxygenase protein 1 n=1 Tax=Montipora capricornis TaxID=246305 RepID=UPI0035F109B8
MIFSFAFSVLLLEFSFPRMSAATGDLLSTHTFLSSLDEDQNVKLYWNVSETRKEILFTVEANTLGWVGFGISSGQGKMEGADIVIGWVKDGKPYFQDRHAEGHMLPEKDAQQDYQLISLTEDNGKTIMKLKRKFDTCDPDDNKIEPGTTKVIYAYHHDDPLSENSIPQHSPQNRGARSVFFLNAASKRPTLPPDTKQFELIHNKTTIPTDETSYMCVVHEIPRLNEKHHIIKIEPLIQLGNEGVVHHILLYECRDDFPVHHLNYSGKCYRSNMPPPLRECTGRSAIAGWAIGGKAFYYPEHAGFPIGTADSPKVVILEIHYDNPEKKEGIIDSSGFRFYYTKQLRKYDAGLLVVGASADNALMIPPKETNWEINGYCNSNCTRQGFKGSKLPEGGINVFASMSHTHLTGRKIFLRHIRNEVELPEISRDDHYDFNFQEYQTMRKEVHVAPGDALINVCVYDSTDRTGFTRGGLGTRDEMCISLLLYYPKVNTSLCLSSEQPAWQKWDEQYLKQNYELLGKPTFWSGAVDEGLKEAYRETKTVLSFCVDKAKQVYGVSPKPVIKKPYQTESMCKDTVSVASNFVPGYFSVLVTITCLIAFIR